MDEGRGVEEADNGDERSWTEGLGCNQLEEGGIAGGGKQVGRGRKRRRRRVNKGSKNKRKMECWSMACINICGWGIDTWMEATEECQDRRLEIMALTETSKR